MTCPHGHPIKPGARFCTTCGAPADTQPAAPPPPAAVRPAASPIPAVVWVLGIVALAAAAGTATWLIRRGNAPEPGVTLDAPQTTVTLVAATVPVATSAPGSGTTAAAGSTAPETTTPASTTVPAAPIPVWDGPEALPPAAAGSVARGLVETGVGVVAVGSDPSSGLARAAVWTSADGTVWERVPEVDGFRAAAGGAWMHDVAVYRDGVVAVGAADDGRGRDVAVWTSTDGTTWARVPMPGGAADGDQTADAVTLTPDGLVAVGWADWPDGEGGLEILWAQSTDGVEWYTSLLPDEGDQAMVDVAWVDGTLVAVGFDQDVEDGTFDAAGGGWEGAVWVSADPNRPWTRVRPDFLSDPQVERIDGVVAFGDTAVLVGGQVGPHGDMDVAVWLWSAASGLRQVVQDGFAVAGAEYLDTVVVAGGRLMAVGRRLGAAGDYDLIAWTSPDGLVWEPMPVRSPTAPDEKVVALSPAGPGAVAVGAVDGAAACWTAMP